MSDKLNDLADFLGEQMAKIEALKIKEPTLIEIQKDADEFFNGKIYTERQRRVYIEGLMASKIVELERTNEVLKNQLIKR